MSRIVHAWYHSFTCFMEDNCATHAASVAFYTVFSLPPLTFLLVTFLTATLSMVADSEDAERRARRLVERHAAVILGNQTIQKEIGAILSSNERESRSWWKSAIGIAGVFIGATGVLAALQDALNRVWRVAPRKRSHQWFHFVLKRILSLAMVLGFGFILLVSFVINTAIEIGLSAIGDRIGVSVAWATVANYIVSLIVITIMLGGMYRYMPDVRIGWRDVSLAAGLASILFSIGRAVLHWYFEFANPAAQLGSAAASLAALLIWVYYTCMIVLLGAEFSKSWALVNGRRIIPEPGAARTAPLPELSCD